MPESIEGQARRTPHATAVVYEERTLSYAELDARANQLAWRLRRLGVKPEVLVGLCVERSEAMVVAALGILKAGGAYLALDPAYPAQRLDYMLADSQAAVLITERSAALSLGGWAGTTIWLDDDGTAISSEPRTAPPPLADPEDLAYVIYTSGSTGRPKGVEIRHCNLVNFLHASMREPGIAREDVLLAIATLCFDVSVMEIFLPLVSGACLVIADRQTAADATRLAEIMDRRGVTILHATPATWRLLVQADWRPSRPVKVCTGGEPLDRELAAALLERSGPLWNLYGPSETTIGCTAALIDPEPDAHLDRPTNCQHASLHP